MIIPFSENQIEDHVSRFVRDSEVHKPADGGPTRSVGDCSGKPKSIPFEISMERMAFLPLEVLQEKVSYTNGYVCCVLGMDLSLPHIRQCMFWSGGPGRALSEILSRGGDLRALLTIKDHVPSDIAIAKTVEAGNKRMLARVLAVWETRESDMGKHMAFRDNFHDAVDMIHGVDYGDGIYDDDLVREANAYYLRMGREDMIDESIYDPYGVYVEGSMDITPKVYGRIMYGSCTRTKMDGSCTRTKILVASKMGSLKDVLRAIDEEDEGPCSMACFAIRSCPPKDALKIYDRYSSSGRGDHDRYDMALLEAFSSSRDLSCLPKDHRMYLMICDLLSMDPSTPCLNALECCNKYRIWDESGTFIQGAVDEYFKIGGTTEILDDFVFRHDDNWRYMEPLQLTRLFLMGKLDRRCMKHLALTKDLDDETIMERVFTSYRFKDVDEFLWFYGRFPGTPVITRGTIPGIIAGCISFMRPYRPWYIECGSTQWALPHIDVYLCLEYYF